jgi:hypothetical protein
MEHVQCDRRRYEYSEALSIMAGQMLTTRSDPAVQAHQLRMAKCLVQVPLSEKMET